MLGTLASASLAQPIRTRVRPCEFPASIVAKTAGKSDSSTSRFAISARWAGFHSPASRSHTSSRTARALPAEATPFARAFTIPGTRAIESLNVAAAVNISLYELNRHITSSSRR